jgi:adenylate cyclase
VRKAGDRVRVSVQLVNTADSFQLWAETYERNLDDIFEVQDEIARNVIHSLKVNFNLPTEENQVVAKPTENVDAYALFLKGMHHWKKHTPSDTEKAVEIFNEALGLDPQYSAAQCALSQCYSFLGSCGSIPPTDAYARALSYAMTAIENNPKLAEGHLAMANIKFFHFWDWEGAHASLLKAESLGLNSALFNQTYGLYLSSVRKLDQGVAKMQRPLELDPLSLQVMDTLTTLYIFNEQYDKAIFLYDEILELEPSFRGAFGGD